MSQDEEAHHRHSSQPTLNEFGLPKRNPLRAVGIDGGYLKGSDAPSTQPTQSIKGLAADPSIEGDSPNRIEELLRELHRAKAYLWHGSPNRALCGRLKCRQTDPYGRPPRVSLAGKVVVARSSGCMTIVGLTGPAAQDIAVANLFLALLGTCEL
jgi:hypothetical protein